MIGSSAAARTVIVISSHVVRGTVGNRAMVFALETLGIPVWAVPTIILPWHPGHGPATRIVPPAESFAALMADLRAAPWLGEVSAIISGYLGDAAQAGPVADLVDAVKTRNRHALYLCDPVTGDKGGLYVPEDRAEAIRDRLLPRADIATPNRYELEWLSGRRLDGHDAIVEAARGLGPKRVVVTSAPGRGKDRIGNLLVTRDEARLAEHAVIARPPNGPGDLLAALFLARLLKGQSEAGALEHATASVHDVLARAGGADELALEADAECLRSPAGGVFMSTCGDRVP